MSSVELLKKLTLAAGISGFENSICEIMKNEIGQEVPFLKDRLGSIAFECKGEKKSPTIMVVGHQDEIGFIVTHITETGLLKFHEIGGWDWRNLLSSPVEIINSNGDKVFGVIGAIPVHYTGGERKEMKTGDMFIDIGALSAKDVMENFGISIGAPVVPKTDFQYKEKNDLLFSKAFDDRVGIAIVIELAKHLTVNSHPNTVYCCGSVQEEVGTRGARTISNLINPDLAIVLEGVPADDFPGNELRSQNGLGQGVHLRLFDPTIIIKPQLVSFVSRLASEHHIPIQPVVRTSGGTDAREIHISNIGVPTLVLGVPVRYAHSHNGIISMKDYKNCLELVKIIVSVMSEDVLEGVLA